MNFKIMGAAGILGPFFLLFLPVLFFSEKRKNPEFKYFAILSLSGIITYIFTPHVLRYFLPTVPFLSAAYGLALIDDKIYIEKIKKILLPLCLGLNIFFLLNHIITFQILQFSLGYIDRQAFLNNFMSYYNAAKFCSQNLPPQSKILLVGEARTFYFKQDCYANHPGQDILLEKWIKESSSLNDFLNLLKEKGIEYILFNYEEMDRVKGIRKRENFFQLNQKEEELFNNFKDNHLELIYRDNFTELFKIK